MMAVNFNRCPWYTVAIKVGEGKSGAEEIEEQEKK